MGSMGGFSADALGSGDGVGRPSRPLRTRVRWCCRPCGALVRQSARFVLTGERADPVRALGPGWGVLGGLFLVVLCVQGVRRGVRATGGPCRSCAGWPRPRGRLWPRQPDACGDGWLHGRSRGPSASRSFTTSPRGVPTWCSWTPGPRHLAEVAVEQGVLAGLTPLLGRGGARVEPADAARRGWAVLFRASAGSSGERLLAAVGQGRNLPRHGLDEPGLGMRGRC